MSSGAGAKRVQRVALTGGIATGKSYCLRRFAQAGVPTIDADTLAREAVAPGSMGLAAVAARFGADIVRPDGRLDRAALGQRVFADPDARRDRQAIVHPRVYAAINDWFAAIDSSDATASWAVADVPLLYETDHAGDFDTVVVAACSPAQQLARLMARDGLTEAEAGARIESQWPIEDKAQRADHVIDTSGTTSETDAQIDEFLAQIRR